MTSPELFLHLGVILLSQPSARYAFEAVDQPGRKAPKTAVRLSGLLPDTTQNWRGVGRTPHTKRQRELPRTTALSLSRICACKT